METIREIVSHGSDTSVDNLERLQYETNLEKLQLNADGLTDIEPVSKLSNLNSLFLVNSSISDVSKFEINPKLETLHINPAVSFESFQVCSEPKVTNETVVQIADKFPNLKNLN